MRPQKSRARSRTAHGSSMRIARRRSCEAGSRCGKFSLKPRRNRRRFVGFAIAALVLACAAMIVFGLRFNSDILDLLPRDFDSVQTLKICDREFTNARQLTFALVDDTHGLDLDDLTSRFADALKRE